MLARRDFLRRAAGATVLVGGSAAVARALHAAAKPVTLTVYKSPTCGCCVKWVEHLRAQPTIRVVTKDMEDIDSVKAQLGVPASLGSCHTGVAAGYVFEGHVPGDLVARVLRERPRGLAGLAVPGMPVGSPGMEVGKRKDPYDVVAFMKDGTTRVYAKR